MAIMGSLQAITIFAEKGQSGTAAQSAVLISGGGLKGDVHSNGGRRSLSITTLETRRWMDKQPEKGLCFARFKENLLIDKISIAPLHSGSLLKIGCAIIEISGSPKLCFPECMLFQSGQECRLKSETAFAATLEGGTIYTGDSVTAEGE